MASILEDDLFHAEGGRGDGDAVITPRVERALNRAMDAGRILVAVGLLWCIALLIQSYRTFSSKQSQSCEIAQG